jgi:hypothetical protein
MPLFNRTLRLIRRALLRNRMLLVHHTVTIHTPMLNRRSLSFNRP